MPSAFQNVSALDWNKKLVQPGAEQTHTALLHFTFVDTSDKNSNEQLSNQANVFFFFPVMIMEIN